MTAVVAPVAVGAALAVRSGRADPWAIAAAFAGALLIQIGTNFANDVFDFEKGADTAERRGPLRVTQAGLVTPPQVKRAMWIAFALAVLCGGYLVWMRGWPLVAIGAASIASGILYTGGPRPLGYLGLGDLFVFVFFGAVAVCGTVFVAVGAVPWQAGLFSVPVGASCTAILVVNNLRDAPTDAKVGKRTLAVRFGEEFARREFAALWVVALLVPVAFAARGLMLPLLLPLLLLPAVSRLVADVQAARDPAVLNAALATTAKLHLVSGLLLATGLLLA